MTPDIQLAFCHLLPALSTFWSSPVHPSNSRCQNWSEEWRSARVGEDKACLSQIGAVALSPANAFNRAYVQSRIQTWQKIAFNISNPVKSMLTTKISEKTWAGSFLAWRCQKRCETCYETTSVSSCCWRSMRISNTMTVLKLGPAHWPMKFCRHKWS